MAKKKGLDKGLRAGLERLRSDGLPVDRPSEELIPRLKSYIGKNRESDLAVAYLLGRIAHPAALEALISLEKESADRQVKKEVRRALFKLAQKGISAPEKEAVRPAVRRPLLKAGIEIEGYLSSVDGTGSRLVWLVRPEPGRGLQLLQAMVSDRVGLVRVGGALIRRKELRRMAEEIKEKHGVTMISAPWEYCDLIIYQGYERAKASGRGGIEGFSSLRALFTTTRPKPLPHPVYGRMDAEGVRVEGWRDRSRRLLDEPEFRFWILDEDWMKPYLDQAQEAQESRLVLSDIQKEERFAGIVRDAARELFSGERGSIFQRRMEDMALYLLATGRGDRAGLALAVALEIQEGNPSGLDISFLTGLVQKSLAFYLGQAKAKAAEEPSFIVKP